MSRNYVWKHETHQICDGNLIDAMNRLAASDTIETLYLDYTYDLNNATEYDSHFPETTKS